MGTLIKLKLKLHCCCSSASKKSKQAAKNGQALAYYINAANR
jgi:hypothetical protein